MIEVPVIKKISINFFGLEFILAVFFSLALLAFLVFFIFYLIEAKRKKLNMKEVIISFFISYLGVIIGSRIFFYFLPWWSWHKDWTLIYRITRFINPFTSGMVFYGGILGGIFTLWLYCKIRKLNFWKYIDAAAPATLISVAIARLGCFLTDDTCRGVASSLPWAVTRIKEGVILHDGAIHPAPFYATVMLTIIFIIVWNLRKTEKYDGWLTLVGLIGYSGYRFLIEFIRYYPEKLFRWITPSHLWSAIVFAVVLYLFIKKNKEYDKKKKKMFHKKAITS
ncbi:MAG: prolipoprotein diacylglyceryl transferase family protein [Candidatus Woesearchaeota archaeon]